MAIPEPTTARLKLVNPDLSHVDPLAELFSDREVMKFIGIGKPWSRAQVEARIERGMGLNADGLPYFWTVTLADTGEVMGQAGVVPIHFDGAEIELGYRLGLKYWGHGYATEAAEGAMQCAFAGADTGGLGFERLVAVTYPDNHPSRRVLSKLGFREVGMSDKYYGVESLLHERLRG
jgi:RimJ/RimL family protein N-acetyltransferase